MAVDEVLAERPWNIVQADLVPGIPVLLLRWKLMLRSSTNLNLRDLVLGRIDAHSNRPYVSSQWRTSAAAEALTSRPLSPLGSLIVALLSHSSTLTSHLWA